MFIGITGTPCAGQQTLADILVKEYGFHLLEYDKDIPSEEVISSVTVHWKKHFVMTHIEKYESLNLFRKRPFFMIVAVDAPMAKRFQFHLKKFPVNSKSLEDFIQLNDNLIYDGKNLNGEVVSQSVHRCMEKADVLVLNTGTLDEFRLQVLQLDLTNKERLRPSWDTYFMLLAELAARRSNCMKRRVGAMLVRDSLIIATGYNGTPRNTRNCLDGGCQRCNTNAGVAQHLDQCLCIHAEENALLEAGRDRSSGGILYCNTSPCLGCAKKIVQAGVKEVIYATDYGLNHLTSEIFKEAGVIFRQHTTTTTRHLSFLGWQGDR